MHILTVDPRRFRLGTLVSMGRRARHELALRAVGSLTTSKLTLGRCLLAIQETRDFKNFGCSSSTHYACAKLGMSRREANECKRVARALMPLPELTFAAEEGRIAWGKLREIVRVASPETDEFWLELSKRYTDNQIQILVSKTPHGCIPGDVDLADSLSRSVLKCPLDAHLSLMLDRAMRVHSLKKNEASTLAEVLSASISSYLADNPLDDEAEAKAREEADKDLQAARARLIPEVAAVREMAVRMGLIRPDEETGEEEAELQLDPGRVLSQQGKTCLVAGCGTDGVGQMAAGSMKSEGHGTSFLDSGRVQSPIATANLEAGRGTIGVGQTAAGSMKSEGYDTSFLDPGRVHSDEHSASGNEDTRCSCGDVECSVPSLHAGHVNSAAGCRAVSSDPGRVPIPSDRTSELLAKALGMAVVDDALLISKNPDRVQYVTLDDPWASTRVRFNIDARYATKAQKNEILRREGWCCSTPGCCNRIWLHIHHLERFVDGGKTSPRNLLGLCSACHKNVHDGLLKIERQTDGSLLFRDQEGRRLDHQVDLEMAYWLDYEIGWTGGEYDSYKARCGVDWAVFAS